MHITKTLPLNDQLISALDNGLRNIFSHPEGTRASPSNAFKNDPIENNERLKKLSASLMRVNHVGEICAQALYQGQAITSRSKEVSDKMHHAALEEVDHLDWCFKRIRQLDSHTSVFNPLWYLGSFMIGVSAGIAGDKWSLGFLAETEHQVVQHLETHLERLPESDIISRAIIKQMIIDEKQHENMAIENGAASLPSPVRSLMKISAKIMTKLSEKM